MWILEEALIYDWENIYRFCADKAGCYHDNRDFWPTDSLVDLSIWGPDTLNDTSNCTLVYSNGTVLFSGNLFSNDTTISMCWDYWK